MAGTEMDIINKVFLVTGGTSIRVRGFPNRYSYGNAFHGNVPT
jgi:hypothetical protein